MNIINNFINIKPNDRIYITISDCGIGYATVLEKDKNGIKILVEEETWTCCYDCQSLIENIFYVCVDEITEVTIC